MGYHIVPMNVVSYRKSINSEIKQFF